MDAAEQFVEDVHTQLVTLGTPYPHLFGSKERNEHGDAPLVNWWLGPIDFEDVKSTDAIDEQTIYIDLQTLGLRIWHTSDELVRTALHNIMAAARAAGYGPSLIPGRFEWSATGRPEQTPTQMAQHLRRACSVTGTLQVRLLVPAEPVGLVTIESVQHNAYAFADAAHGGELQVTDNEPGEP